MTTAIQKQAATVRQLFENPSTLKKISEAVPRMVDGGRLARIALGHVMANQRLLSCSQQSLMTCLLECAKLGLEPGVLGQCWFIPYGQTAQLQIGYKGTLALCRRSGDIANVQAECVYEGDTFEFERGTDLRLRHPFNPNRTEFPDKDITHVYAIVTLKDGSQQIAVMTRAQVDAHRRRFSKAKDGPWFTDFPEMAKKTVLIRAMKYAPMSADVAVAIERDQQRDAGVDPDMVDVTVVDAPEPDPDADLADKVAGKRRSGPRAASPSDDLPPDAAEHHPEAEVAPAATETPSGASTERKVPGKLDAIRNIMDWVKDVADSEKELLSEKFGIPKWTGFEVGKLDDDARAALYCDLAELRDIPF